MTHAAATPRDARIAALEAALLAADTDARNLPERRKLILHELADARHSAHDVREILAGAIEATFPRDWRLVLPELRAGITALLGDQA